MWCIGDDSSHLLFSEANLTYMPHTPQECMLHGTYVTGFGKINHFVTFDTSNIYGQNMLYTVQVNLIVSTE